MGWKISVSQRTRGASIGKSCGRTMDSWCTEMSGGCSRRTFGGPKLGWVNSISYSVGSDGEFAAHAEAGMRLLVFLELVHHPQQRLGPVERVNRGRAPFERDAEPVSLGDTLVTQRAVRVHPVAAPPGRRARRLWGGRRRAGLRPPRTGSTSSPATAPNVVADGTSLNRNDRPSGPWTDRWRRT